MNTFEKIPTELNTIGTKIVDAAYTVHKNLGPGLLEKVYEICFCHELTSACKKTTDFGVFDKKASKTKLAPIFRGLRSF